MTYYPRLIEWHEHYVTFDSQNAEKRFTRVLELLLLGIFLMKIPTNDYR